MKILCPTDFSKNSVHALSYGLNLFKDIPNLNITLIHCFNLASRSAMFMKMDALLRENAEKDMNALIEEMKSKYSNANFDYDIYKGDPKSIVPAIIKKYDFDYVLIGTKGMSELKELVMGSLTNTVIESCIVPVLAVPENAPLESTGSILLALDSKIKNISDSNIKALENVVTSSKSKLNVCHVRTTDEESDLHYVVSGELSHLSYDYETVDLKENLANTLEVQMKSKDADILTLLHRHRSWWEKLFLQSFTAREMFDLNHVLLVLNAE